MALRSINGSQPLSNDDAEKAVFSAFLASPAVVAERCLHQLKPEVFSTPERQELFDLLFEWPYPTRAIDFAWLKPQLQERGLLDRVGGVEFLNELYAFGTPPENVEYYIHDLQEFGARRTFINDATARIEAAKAGAPATEWDPDGKYIGALCQRKLRGASFLDFSGRAIDDSTTLLGNRYLCRGGGMFAVAPSGHGKSVLVAQATILWACGLEAFGIKPARPLRSLVVQAEDDEGDMIEMAQIVDHLQLNEQQRALVSKNTHIEFVNDVTGEEFVRVCDGFLGRFKADLLWINPYLSYLGEDIKDGRANTQFLRNWLNPVMTLRECAVIIVHHTPKTNFRDTTTWKPSDWMYSGAGAADLTNWARAYLVIDPCEQTGLYKFIAAKRGRRIGWGDRLPVFERYFAWSTNEGELLWLDASADQISSAKPRGLDSAADMLPLIPLVDPISQEQLFVAAKQARSLGVNKVRTFVKILLDEGKIRVEPIKRTGVKSGVGYVQTGGQSS